jgi:hypothetical protein
MHLGEHKTGNAQFHHEIRPNNEHKPNGMENQIQSGLKNRSFLMPDIAADRPSRFLNPPIGKMTMMSSDFCVYRHRINFGLFDCRCQIAIHAHLIVTVNIS